MHIRDSRISIQSQIQIMIKKKNNQYHLDHLVCNDFIHLIFYSYSYDETIMKIIQQYDNNSNQWICYIIKSNLIRIQQVLIIIKFKYFLKMKITIKTLKGQLFNIQAQPHYTIQEVKNKIKQAKNFQVDAQKLVFKGKNTVNTDTLQSLNIKEGDFMVVMVTIKKLEQPKPVQVPKVQEKPKQVQKPVEPTKPVNIVNPPVNINVPKPQTTSSQSNLVVGEQYEATISQLMNMGFDRQQVVNALKAAFNNPQRAVQYLLNGIPSGLQPGNQPVNPPPSNNQQQQNNIPPVNLDPTLLANIINSPQFAHIKQMIRNDPSSLAGFLQQIQNNSPQLANLIQQNPELFQRLIMEDSPLQGGQMSQPPGSIMVTNQQKAAIDRLAALGFSKIQAAQAYMACDKNQQLAANLLFDRLQNGDIQGGESFPQGPEEPEDKDDDDNLFP